MKRMITIALTVLLLCTGIACAQGWADGLGPSQPYSGKPPVDLDSQIGYIMFYPSDKWPEEMRAQNMCQRMYIYLPREDVNIAEGTFYLYTANGKLQYEWPMNSDTVIERPMTDNELDSLLWGGGTCFEIVLPHSLELGESYFINMTEGAIVSEGGVKSPTIGGATAWQCTLYGDYGVSGMEYTRPSEKNATVTMAKAGDQIRFNLELGGVAVEAAIYGHDDTVDFVKTHYDESGEITGEVLVDNPEWGVMFLDMWGNIVGQVEFY